MKTLIGFIGIFSLVLVFTFAASAQVELTSIDGSRINIEGQKGKVVVMAIGASWLPLSIKQADLTNALAKKYAGKNVQIYFIATDSADPKSKNFAETAAIRKFGSDNKLSVTILRDSDGALTLKKYRIEQVPSFIILDKSGAMVGEPFGGISTDPKYDLTIVLSKVIDKIL